MTYALEKFVTNIIQLFVVRVSTNTPDFIDSITIVDYVFNRLGYNNFLINTDNSG